MRWPWHRGSRRSQRQAPQTAHPFSPTHRPTGQHSTPPRSRVVSRPRVAYAAAQAAAAYHAADQHDAGERAEMSLGSAVAGPTAYLVRGRPVLMPMSALTEAAALAAREAGRAPEEVWAEALHIWLEERAPGYTEDATAPRLQSPSRERAWQEIEQTLRVLRAS